MACYQGQYILQFKIRTLRVYHDSAQQTRYKQEFIFSRRCRGRVDSYIGIQQQQQLLENTVISKIVIANENMGFEIKLK